MRHAIVHDPRSMGARSLIAFVLKASVVALFLIAVLGFAAFAQQPGVRTLELNTFGRYTDFAPSTNLQSGVGGGLRLGYFVLPRWELEGGIGFTRVDPVAGSGSRSVVPILLECHLQLSLPIGSTGSRRRRGA